jgi:hypothetical protein
MLLGQRLRRSHQGCLETTLHRSEHCEQRDDGLAAADLPHQQALCRLARGELSGEHRDRRLLV